MSKPKQNKRISNQITTTTKKNGNSECHIQELDNYYLHSFLSVVV